jgi:hypothetical protein
MPAASSFHHAAGLLVATILSAQCTDVRVITPGVALQMPPAADHAAGSAPSRDPEHGFLPEQGKNILACAQGVRDFGGLPHDGRVGQPLAGRPANILLYNAGMRGSG